MAPIKNPRIIVSPAIQATRGTAKVSVYRDTKGDFYIRPFGAKLTKAEKQKKLTRAHGKTANALRDFYTNPENLDYKLKFTKSGSGIEKTRYLQPATIDGRAGWFDTRNGKFIFKEQRSKTPNRWGEYWNHYGTMQLNLRSVDSTAYGLTQRGSLETFYLRFINAKEKAKLTEALADLDWENDVYAYFETSDPTDSAPAGAPNTDAEKKGYDAVVSVIERTVGVKWLEYRAMVG